MANSKPLGDADTIGHDLKSPLGTIISALEVVREIFQANTDLQGLMNDALLAAYYQNGLIENMVDYLRICAEEDFDLKIMPLDVASVLREVEMRMAERLARKQFSVEYDIPDGLPLVQADQSFLLRVVIAILENSLKFCTRQDRLRIEARVAAERLLLDIKDTGRAILPQFHDILFEPTRQMEARLAGSRTSLALNLPFANVAMRLMGGQVSAASEGGWTVFTLHLPRA